MEAAAKDFNQFLKKMYPQKGKIKRNGFSKTSANIVYLGLIALNPFILEISLQ